MSASPRRKLIERRRYLRRRVFAGKPVRSADIFLFFHVWEWPELIERLYHRELRRRLSVDIDIHVTGAEQLDSLHEALRQLADDASARLIQGEP